MSTSKRDGLHKTLFLCTHSMQNRYRLNLEFLVTQIKIISDERLILLFDCKSLLAVRDFFKSFLLKYLGTSISLLKVVHRLAERMTQLTDFQLWHLIKSRSNPCFKNQLGLSILQIFVISNNYGFLTENVSNLQNLKILF